MGVEVLDMGAEVTNSRACKATGQKRKRGSTMSGKIWLARSAGVALALALCSWATAARADDDGARPPEPGDDARGVPELDPRAAGLGLTVLGGSLFVLHGRRKRSTRVAV
jgi:hypothetical protein